MKRSPTRPELTVQREALDQILDRHAAKPNPPSDPILFPRRRQEAGACRQDVESVALLSAMLAFGRLPLFMKILDRIFALCPPPYPAGFRTPSRHTPWPGYRFCRGGDIRRFCELVARVSTRQGGLREAFEPGWKTSASVWDGLATLRAALLREAGTSLSPGLRYLLPDPKSGGCSKRWMMFLRWMVRPDDGTDLGQWPSVPASALIVPLDRHIGRFARRFGWTKRQSDDRRAAEEITAALRTFCPEDPLRYDFALAHLGIDGDCSHRRDLAVCPACPIRSLCSGADKDND